MDGLTNRQTDGQTDGRTDKDIETPNQSLKNEDMHQKTCEGHIGIFWEFLKTDFIAQVITPVSVKPIHYPHKI